VIPIERSLSDDRELDPKDAASNHLAGARRGVGDHREPILNEHDPPKSTGRPRVDQRAAFDAIIFRMRSGCQWNRLPTGEFPEDSSVHRTFQRWIELGVLDLIWERLIEECEDLAGVDFEWQAADGAMGKARFGGT
jgi:putative transposase